VTYEWYGSSYRFTEEDTDGLSLEALEWWPLIRAARSRVSEVRDEQNARMAALTQEAHQPQPFTNGMKTPGSG
jgi:hypothetical protein